MWRQQSLSGISRAKPILFHLPKELTYAVSEIELLETIAAWDEDEKQLEKDTRVIRLL